MRTQIKAYYLLIGFFWFFAHKCLAQDQKIADSIARIYHQYNFNDTIKLELLRNLAFNEVNDLQLALKYAEGLIEQSTRQSNDLYLHRGYFQKGNKKRLLGDLEEALDAYFKSIDAAKNANYIEGEGNALVTIADVYSVMGNSSNAKNYYNKSIKILRNANDSISLATALLNAGDEYFKSENYDSALLYFEESGLIFNKFNYKIGTAYNLGNSGMVYAELDKDNLAESNINKAISILEELEDYYPIAVYLTYMSDIYFNKGENPEALSYALRSLEIAKQYGLKQQISDANLKLAEYYEEAGDFYKSYVYYKNHIAYRDSVKNLESIQKMADLRTDFEVSQKQIEVDLLNQERKNQRIVNIATAITSVLIFLLALGLYRRYKYIKETSRIIQIEKDRSESLLLNILPQETAQELKESGRVEAKKFESATVLFSDFKEFTRLASSVDPEQLVKSIDYYFKAFDEIISKYGLEKIKTIGDAYMCAGGIPTESFTHPKNVIKAAKEMIDFVESKLPVQDDLVHFEIRIGVHTGPVVAGIVGLNKWQYDIWGDTVNIASRMESMSEPGKINLSETTYNEIRDEFPCKYRGKIEVKHRGQLKMYFLL